MREGQQWRIGQAHGFDTQKYQDEFLILAKKHYVALRKIKDGKPRHVERIYRRIIDEIVLEDDEVECDHAKLAVTTLLLALHLQREAQSVCLHFFASPSLGVRKIPNVLVVPRWCKPTHSLKWNRGIVSRVWKLYKTWPNATSHLELEAIPWCFWEAETIQTNTSVKRTGKQHNKDET